MELKGGSDVVDQVNDVTMLSELEGSLAYVNLKMDDIKGRDSEENSEVICYLITKNETLEGDIHPMTGVPFERKIVETQDGLVEGVFPKFESKFDAEIPGEMDQATDYSQFKACNRQLYDYLQENPEAAEKFTDVQLEQIEDGLKDGSAPDGYTWHHSEETGKIQLVDSEVHAMTGHTGGRSVWGGGTENR